jgi:uncharacterized protein
MSAKPRRSSIARRSGRSTLLLVALLSAYAHAAEVIPPKPAGYFNDYAAAVSQSAAYRFNEQLAQFERETSNQVVVAIFPKMQSDDDIAAYTQRVAQSWGVGQKDKRNGVVLFVFTQDRKMFIQVGYGLEGALPDATAFDITERRIKPRFRANDFEGGIAVGIDSILQAIRGEYKGSGQTAAEGKTNFNPAIFVIFWLIFAFIVVRRIARFGRRGYRYSRRGGPYVGWWGGGGGGGWSSGGGGGGFSGFSGGGGSFGGGGGGSSW